MGYGKKIIKNGHEYRVIPLKSYWRKGKLVSRWETRPIIKLPRETEIELQKQYIEKYGATKLPPHIPKSCKKKVT